MRAIVTLLMLLALSLGAYASDVDGLLGNTAQSDEANEPSEPFYVYA